MVRQSFRKLYGLIHVPHSGFTIRHIGKRYTKFSTKHPYAIASVSGGSILFAADVTAQCISKRKIISYEEWDSRRTCGLSLFGFLYYGGPCKFIYFGYEKIIGPSRFMTTAFVDVLVHTPFMVVPAFYCLTGIVKGQTASEWVGQLKADWLEAAFGSILFWTPLQLVCFRCIPQAVRIPFISTGAFFHKAWLSWLSNKK